MMTCHAIRDLLPATSVEIAAELGITVRVANAFLQGMAKCKRQEYRVMRTNKIVKEEKGRRGRAPYIWELV